MEDERENKERKTDYRAWTGSREEITSLKEKIKEYGFESHADDISIACYDMQGDSDFFDFEEGGEVVEYRLEEQEYFENKRLLDTISLIRFLKNMPKGDGLRVLSNKETRSANIGHDLAIDIYDLLVEDLIERNWGEYASETDKNGFSPVPSFFFSDVKSKEEAIWRYRRGKVNVDEILDYEDQRLKTVIPLEYYIGRVLSDAVTELRSRGAFDKSVKTLRIKEACVLYDALVIYGAKEEDNKAITGKQKYDFVKNKIKAYQDYINKKR